MKQSMCRLDNLNNGLNGQLSNKDTQVKENDMTIYSTYFGAWSSNSRAQPLTVYVGIFFLTIVLLGGSVSAFGAETQKQTQTIEKKKYNDELVRELREVKNKYPLLAERLGLVHRLGFRVPLLCLGGVDPQCHRLVQQSCIDSMREHGRPDFQFCLDQANQVCCKPAVFDQ